MDSVVLGLRVLVSLGAVLALIWVLQRRVKRRGGLVRAAGPALSVLGRQTLGHKASVVLLDADGQRLLLGVTEHGVSVLSTAAADGGAAPAAAAASASGSFAASLSAATAASSVALPASPSAAEAPLAAVPRLRERRSATTVSAVPTRSAAAETPVLDLPAGTAAVTTSFSGPDHGSILLAATAPATEPAVPAGTGAARMPSRPRGRHAATAPVSSSPLSGSILDLGTWRQARDAARWVAGGRRP